MTFTRITTYAPLIFSFTLGGLIILQVILIVNFSDTVSSYYTPAILSFENLMEGSQHLKIVTEGDTKHQQRDNIAVKHFLFALNGLKSQINTLWPKERIHLVQRVLNEAEHVGNLIETGKFEKVDQALGELVPILVEHTKAHKEELNKTRQNIRTLSISVGVLCLLLLALGYRATMRERKVSKLQSWQRQTSEALTALITALEAREPYTKGHSVRVAKYSLAIADQLGLNEQDRHQLHMSALLHDIGKIGVPDSILLKEGKLTHEEFAVMKTHPEIGARILSNVESLSQMLPIIRHHHERHDGQGYPDGLSGAAIPLLARIISVADTYDAMTTTRPYRKSLTPEEARNELLSLRNVQWNREIVDAFIVIMENKRLQNVVDSNGVFYSKPH